MAPKRTSTSTSSDTSASKKRKSITLECKLEIIKRSEKGETPTNIGRALGYSRTTVSTIIHDKARLLEHMKKAAPLKDTIISKKRSSLIIEMESLLMLWLEDQNRWHIPISLALIQEKARSLFNNLKKRATEEGELCDENFTASKGWFQRFRTRANLHNSLVQVEAASVSVSAEHIYNDLLKQLIEKGDYLPEQLFNVDETGLFWKRMPSRTYISKEEKGEPGHKAQNDRITLLLGANATGDCKLKPMLVSHYENPRALNKIIKAALPVIWKANLKAWVTLALFEDWFLNHFVPAAEKYCNAKNIPFKILLMLDNAPGHPSTLNDLHPNVKVVFLPPNITYLLQPMDQGVIASFKAYYLRHTFGQAVWATQDDRMSLQEFWQGYSIYDAIKNIAHAWDEIKPSSIKRAWSKLCPQFAHGLTGFTEDDIAKARKAIVDIGNQLQLEIEESDVVELLESHGEELTNEGILELEKQPEEHGGEIEIEDQDAKMFTTKKLAKAFSLVEEGMALFEKQDANLERFTDVYRKVTNALNCYKVIYDEKKKLTAQSSLDSFFQKLPRTLLSIPDNDQTSHSNPDHPLTRYSSHQPGPSSAAKVDSPISE